MLSSVVAIVAAVVSCNDNGIFFRKCINNTLDIFPGFLDSSHIFWRHPSETMTSRVNPAKVKECKIRLLFSDVTDSIVCQTVDNSWVAIWASGNEFYIRERIWAGNIAKFFPTIEKGAFFVVCL